jgi:poly-gamma-glutamate synthesis protein (capsule biosynthesis protein)
MYRLRRRNKKNLLTLAILAAVIIAIGGIGCAAVYKFWPVETPKPVAATKPVVKPHAVSAQSNTLFVGDIYLGRSVNVWAQASPLKYAYPFSKLSEFHRDTYNAWVANLECPTVAGLHLTPAQEEATLNFNCDPGYLPELAKWFNVVTLANNHTDNQGVAGLAETRQHLEGNGVQYFGTPDPRDLENICDVIALPTSVTMSDGQKIEGDLPVAMCGYHGFIRLPSDEAIAVMNEYSKYMPVIAMPHAGTEYKAAPDTLKTNLYRSMIDNGADMVLGGHPHWVQTTESYKGHLIVYSMGNFIFDQQGNQEVTRSAAVNVQFDVQGTDTNLLAKWLALGKTCSTYHDDCLAQAKAQNLARLPYTFRFGVVSTDDSNKITKPASATVRDNILQRMNWPQTMNQLQVPYTGTL